MPLGLIGFERVDSCGDTMPMTYVGSRLSDDLLSMSLPCCAGRGLMLVIRLLCCLKIRVVSFIVAKLG